MDIHTHIDTDSTLIQSIARVDLRVQDIVRSLTFYRDIVGLEVSLRDEDVAEVGPPGGPAILRLDSSSVTGPAEQGVTGLFHTAIRFPDRKSLADALARLVQGGYQIAAGDHVVSEALYIDDPDGNGVELYRDRPRESWPGPSRGMKIPLVTGPVDLQALLDESDVQALSASAPPGTDIGHVHLQVADISETTSFYVDVLQLDVMAQLGDQAVFVSSNGYHHNLGANTWYSRGGPPASRSRAGLARVTFVATEADFSSLAQRLENSPCESWSKDEELTVVDPSGVSLQFVVASDS